MATVKILRKYDITFQGEKGLCMMAFAPSEQLITTKQEWADEMIAAGAAEEVKTPSKGKNAD